MTDPEPYPFEGEAEVRERADTILNLIHDQIELELDSHEVVTTRSVIDALGKVLSRWPPRESFAICGMLVQHGVQLYEEENNG